jgi:ribose/xylose/arabinose/galactoside ABC-type transport system permease subunit
VGVAILASLQNGFNLLDVSPFYQDIIKGVIVIVAIARVDWRRLLGPGIRREVRVERPSLARANQAKKQTSAI